MKLKTLLLGSAAAFTVVGGAQAADVAKPAAPAQVVKPVAYVQVCDAYGLGYFVIPGQKDTCLRVQGQIQFQINFHTRDTEFWAANTTSWHEAGWDSQAQGKLTFTAKRMTDHGDLTGVIQLTGTSANAANIQASSATNGGANNRVNVDRYVQATLVYVRLGGFEVGYDNSVYGIGTTKQVSYTWSLGTTSVSVGVDDPRDRWGSRLPRLANYPDIVGNINGSASWGTWGFGAGVQPAVSMPEKFGPGAVPDGIGPQSTVWGVNAKATINTPMIAKGDQIALAGSFGTGCAFVVNNCGNGTTDGGTAGVVGNDATMWQAMASFKHVFNPTWQNTIAFQWTNEPTPIAFHKTQAQWQAKDTVVWQGINDRNYQIQGFVAANQSVGAVPHNGVVWSGQVQFVWSY